MASRPCSSARARRGQASVAAPTTAPWRKARRSISEVHNLKRDRLSGLAGCSSARETSVASVPPRPSRASACSDSVWPDLRSLTPSAPLEHALSGICILASATRCDRFKFKKIGRTVGPRKVLREDHILFDRKINFPRLCRTPSSAETPPTTLAAGVCAAARHPGRLAGRLVLDPLEGWRVNFREADLSGT